LEYQVLSECGESVKEECDDGGTEELAEREPLTFWSMDTSIFGTVWLQTASAAEAGPYTQRPLHLHHHLARKPLQSS
jgi:hypothetical protein